MNYPNGQSVSDVKKAATNFGSDMKSDSKKFGSDLKSDLKSDAKSAASKIEKAVDGVVSEGSSIADTVLSTVSSYLPVKSTEAALEMLETTAKDVQSTLMTARDSAGAFIKKYPFYSVLGASLIGAAAVMFMTPRKASAPSTDLH